MGIGISDAKKLVAQIVAEGKFLIVDFSKGVAEFHFGDEVTARESLQMARVRKEYSRHVQRLGKKAGHIKSVGARSAAEQIAAIQSAPTVPQEAMDAAEEKRLIEEQARKDKESSNDNAAELAEQKAKDDARAAEDLKDAEAALEAEAEAKAKADAKAQAEADKEAKKLEKQKIADEKRDAKEAKNREKAEAKAAAKRVKDAEQANADKK